MTKLTVIIVTLFVVTVIYASPPDSVEMDSLCDCEDQEAMYYRPIRQMMNNNVLEGKQSFLKEFRVRRVCGSDGKLYRSRCKLFCTAEMDPKLDLKEADRSTCSNWGRMGLVKTLAKLEKQPAKESKVSGGLEHPRVCICTRHYSPVCASNGVTYGNTCAFECVQANSEPGITIVSHGKCNEEDQTFI